jgi:hypothetical protein
LRRGQRGLIRYYLDAGAGGLAGAVHTTQFAIRSPQIGLYEPILRVASEEIGAYEKKTGKCVIKIAGVCGEEEQAGREAALSKAHGYDAVLLSTGGLDSHDENRLIDRTGGYPTSARRWGFISSRRWAEGFKLSVLDPDM